MTSTNDSDVATSVRSELETARLAFHAVVDSLSEEDMHRQSLNARWTNGEILAHILFGFILVNVLLPLARTWARLPQGSSKPFAWLLNAFTVPFNWFNARGARAQGRVFTYERMGQLYDRAHRSLLAKAASIKDEEWSGGMYYPTRWDANFGEFMTLEKLFLYPVIHSRFHLNQIAR